MILFAGPTLLEYFGGSESGRSIETADRFVVIISGHSLGKTQYVVVRDWPLDSDPNLRNPDPRISTDSKGRRVVNTRSGPISVLEHEPSLYFFEGGEVTVIPIDISESDYFEMRVQEIGHYAEIRELFESHRVQ